jgi:hypothetical protein
MNKNEPKQNIKPKEEEKKKSFLSGLIEVEEEPKVDTVVQDAKPHVNEEVKKTPGKEKEIGLTEEQELLLHTGEGVNLIPKVSKEEVQKEKKKFSLNLSSIVSLIILIVLSLAVVFFNILSKQQLTSANKQLQQRESELETYTDKIISNEEILERIDLYRYLQQGVFSPKEIVEYIMRITEQSGNITIRSIDLSNTLGFEFNGSTTDLAVVAKLWYLLGIDDNIVTINLESVGKGESGVSFSFAGQLKADNFIEK